MMVKETILLRWNVITGISITRLMKAPFTAYQATRYPEDIEQTADSDAIQPFIIYPSGCVFIYDIISYDRFAGRTCL
jgi:hypothetical protein